MKNRTARILVTIFGGWFGLHRYLNHQIALGVLYTFTFGLFGIGWLVDICIACSSVSRKLSYVDSRKVPAVDSILHINNQVFELAYNFNHVELYTMQPFNFSIPFGSPLTFKREPSNDYDSRAIYFIWQNTNIGYIHIGRLQSMMHDYIRSDRRILATYENIDSSGNVLITLSFYKKVK